MGRLLDRWLVAPRPDEVDDALLAAVKAVNGRRRSRALPWPPSDHADYRLARQRDAEGWRQWEGHGDARRRVASEVVWTAWWTDAVGRKHHRVVGEQASLAEGDDSLFSPRRSGRPPLALIYPARVVVRTRGAVRDALCSCPCGVFGPPRPLGWMGTCCGPCHDRREEGHRPAEPERSFLMGVSFSADRHRVAVLAYWGRDIHVLAVGDSREVGAVRDIGPVEQVALSPAGDVVAGALHVQGRGRSVALWEVASGAQVAGFAGHPYGIDGLAFSPDGRTLAVACHNQDVRLFDAGTGELRYVLPGYFGSRQGVAFSPDGKRVATASQGHTIRLWDAQTGAPQQRLAAHCYVPGLAFSPDGSRLVEWASSNNSTDPDLAGWWLDTGQQALRLEGVAGPYGAAFSPDGRWLLWSLAHQSALFADAATGEVCCHLEWAGDPPTALAFTADGGGLVVGGRSGAPLEVWPLAVIGL